MPCYKREHEGLYRYVAQELPFLKPPLRSPYPPWQPSGKGDSVWLQAGLAPVRHKHQDSWGIITCHHQPGNQIWLVTVCDRVGLNKSEQIIPRTDFGQHGDQLSVQRCPWNFFPLSPGTKEERRKRPHLLALWTLLGILTGAVFSPY